MSLIALSFAYIRRRAGSAFLNVMLMSFGIATITLLLLLSVQFEEHLYKNAEGVDVVVGAKGSPIQLILSGLYHMDSPTGNVTLADAKTVMNHRAVGDVYPLALGDSWNGVRIVGSTAEYMAWMGGEIEQGALWGHALDVVVGDDVASRYGVALGDTLISSHGLQEGGMGHADHEMVVTGILKRTGRVTDRLIFTPVETMWTLHSYDAAAGEDELDDGHHHEGDEQHDGHEHDHSPDSQHDSRNSEDYSEEHHEGAYDEQTWLAPEYNDKDITALLISYSTPLGAAQFPRFVNAETPLQAAAPAFEITRLMSIFGVGMDAIQAFGILLILSSALSLLIGLMNAMKDRAYDLAIMRAMGGPKWKLFVIVLVEAVCLSAIGGVMGLALGHGAMQWMGQAFSEAQQFNFTGLMWVPQEGWIMVGAIAIGIIAGLLPAVRAAQTEIYRTLAQSNA
jgi:putative ABC transport system permease protein